MPPSELNDLPSLGPREKESGRVHSGKDASRTAACQVNIPDIWIIGHSPADRRTCIHKSFVMNDYLSSVFGGIAHYLIAGVIVASAIRDEQHRKACKLRRLVEVFITSSPFN